MNTMKTSIVMFLVGPLNESSFHIVLFSEMFQNATNTRQPYTYHIGLSYSSGTWYWEQPAGKPLKRVEWTNWTTGFPVISSKATVGMNVQQLMGEDVETKWQNTEPMGAAEYYVCEVATCDTDNYCDTLDE